MIHDTTVMIHRLRTESTVMEFTVSMPRQNNSAHHTPRIKVPHFESVCRRSVANHSIHVAMMDSSTAITIASATQVREASTDRRL